jgi:peptide-methionine (R)-S-oxide reductase
METNDLNEELKNKLTEEEYKVLREKGTEAPFSGKYVNNTDKGMYVCKVCGQELFSSDTKFESTTPGLQGWPAFADPVNLEHVELREDNSMGMHRTEVLCKKCGSHLGHVFDEDHGEMGNKHYCINSVCLDLKTGDK